MKSVMVVDDEVFARTMLKSVLTSNGFRIAAEAADGDEAVALYQKVRPDLVTMDIAMPGMDGLTALKRIKGLDPHAKIIMCSAIQQKTIILEAIRLGAKDYIVKPCHGAEIIETIDKLLASKPGML
ncbi:response regulator [Paenibacillus sp. MSJ-34]|uniref:response regulator n=1 Tax=Paenibacillus sp. MSJ-34 TaxID=2841529 RepID=UPI001C1027F0|nr:response regulator [Paenibacillus sp. MSJ-34]MBU5441266.1 response regulator [Paenibacillus sp. MSJ-34]